MSGSDRLVGNSSEQKDSAELRDSEGTLGNLHGAWAVQEVGEENSMSGGKQIPDEWIEEEYVPVYWDLFGSGVSSNRLSPGIVFSRREAELAEIYRARLDTL